MAKSKYEYTREFELSDRCLPNAWIVVRIDGRNFHRFADEHKFVKPNDDRALKLMSVCAEKIVTDFCDIILAYGQSDEYSFVFRRKTETFNRRASKLSSTVVSLFAASYVFYWPQFFGDVPLQYPPSFDSRVILYPTTQNLRDYLSWRQVDCHINNLYNLCFWKLIQQNGVSNSEAEKILKATDSGIKNEMLFSQFNTNYNDEPEIHRKGTVIYKSSDDDDDEVQSKPVEETVCNAKKRQKAIIRIGHVDIIKQDFWSKHPSLLGMRPE